MKKRILSFFLAGALSVSAVAGTIISASAIRNSDDTYTPSTGVKTYNYKFAMPGAWVNGVTEKQGNACGTYWWGGSDCPSEVFAHEWPGYKMNKDPDVENLYDIDVPTNTPMIIFNNYIDCGMDVTAPEFEAACQGPDKNVEYFAWGDSDYYTDEFWRYVYSVAAEELGVEDLDLEDDYDELLEEIEDRADELTFAEFGDYADNFYYNEEAEELVYNSDNMVFVIDLRPERMSVSYQIVPEGKINYGGEFFFSYGGGKYGMWPTLELAVEKEGLTLDENGNVVTDGLEVIAYDRNGNPDAEAVKALDGLALDKFDNIIKHVSYTDWRSGHIIHKLVYVYGDFTGKYWTGINPDIPDFTEPTTVPDITEVEKPTVPLGDSNKIYFQVNPSLWKNFNNIYFYLYEHNGDEITVWGSSKGKMTDEGNNLWSLDLAAKKITLDPNKQYGCVFTADWGLQTCDLIIGTECFGDTAYCTGIKVENNVAADKLSYYVKWVNADSTKYAPPLCITSTGNVVGETLWEGTTKYGLLRDFLTSNNLINTLQYTMKPFKQIVDDIVKSLDLSQNEIEEGTEKYILLRDFIMSKNLFNVFQYSGRSVQQIIDDIAMLLDMSQEEVERAVEYARASGKNVDWTPTDPEPTISVGDVNGDGVINITDATLIQMYIAQMIESFE